MATVFIPPMAPSATWLSLTDLGRIYGISAIHCGRALQQQGWRDRHGRPTPGAIEAGAAFNHGAHHTPRAALWNAQICSALLEKTGYQQVSRSLQIEQWVQLLEAMEQGCPSINATAAQMAEELPNELIGDVNHELAQRGCPFRAAGPSSNTRPTFSAAA